MVEKIMLGDFIYKRRKELGMSQSELGDLVGVSNKAVSKWETGESNPDMQLVKPLAQALECTADELLTCQMQERAEPDAGFSQKSESAASSNTQRNGGTADGYKQTRVFGMSGKEKSTSGEYEFISDRMNANRDPFLHIHIGKKLSSLSARAKGTIAIGNVASGKIAVGLVSKGIISVGLISIGIFAIGVLALGLLLSVGTIALGLGASFGAIAVGSAAFGAISVGIVSFGALSIGVYAHTGGNGIAFGLHTFYHF